MTFKHHDERVTPDEHAEMRDAGKLTGLINRNGSDVTLAEIRQGYDLIDSDKDYEPMKPITFRL